MRAFDPHRIRRAPVLWMLAAAVSLVALLVDAGVRGPADPAGQARMASHPGDLTHFLLVGAVELAVLTAVLRPWSYRHAPGRALLALGLWTPWALFALMVCMHCGPIGGALALWRLAMVGALSITLIVSLIGRWRAGRGAVQRT